MDEKGWNGIQWNVPRTGDVLREKKTTEEDKDACRERDDVKRLHRQALSALQAERRSKSRNWWITHLWPG